MLPRAVMRVKKSISLVQLSCVLLVLLCRNSCCAASNRNIIEYLPGYPGKLPFHLETGYVGVGEEEQVQLFYYFVESEGDPQHDPLVLWLTGGPGCSAFSGLVLEVGPLSLNLSSSSWQSEAPKFQLNPYSWTKVASIVFLDSPVGTGFSYATSFEGYFTDDILQSSHVYDFLRKWLEKNTIYKDNPLYISGDSYSGVTMPILLHNILNGNKLGLAPKMNLKGYTLGNPLTWKEDTTISMYEYARRVSLIPDELYESCIMVCNGTYDDLGSHNAKCSNILEDISDNLDPLYENHVLMPKCITPETPCQDSSYQLLETWANYKIVQEVLQIQEGTKTQWLRCNKSVAYEFTVDNTVGYHQNFTRESMAALIYSGDQDRRVSYLGTLGWIKNLDITTTDDWRPWFVGAQVAGYTTKFSNGHYHLTYATVKGAGHTAPEFKPLECFTMFRKWLAMSPL